MENKSLKTKNAVLKLLMGFCAAFGVCISFNTTQIVNVYHGRFASLSSFFDRLANAIGDKSVVLTLLTVFFAMLFWFMAGKYVNKNVILVRLWAAILSITQVVGFSFYFTGSWSLIYSDKFQIFKTIVMLVGFYSIYYYVIHFIYYLVNKSAHNKPKGKISNFLFEKKPFVIITLLMIIERLPIILSSYPVRLIYDNHWEIDEYKYKWLNDHHTIFHTLVVNWFGELGEKLGNQGTGFFIYLILQLIFTSLIVGYCFEIMRKLKAPIWSRWLMFVLFFGTAYSLFYSSFMEKDIPFSYCALLIVAEMILCIVDYKKFFSSKKDIIISIFAITLFCLVRKNGLYVTAVLLLVMIFFFICKSIKDKKLHLSTFVKTVCILLVPIVLMSCFNSVCTKAYNISKGDIKEALSIPFMQTARYIMYYDDEVTDDERTAINDVLDYYAIIYNYSQPTDLSKRPYKDNTCFADYIKNTYRGDDSKLPVYFKVWAKMFLKHPLAYVESTWAMCYSLSSYDEFIYAVSSPEFYTTEYSPTPSKIEEIKKYKEPKWTVATKLVADKFFAFLSVFPGLNLVNDYTTYTILAAIFILLIFNDLKNKKYVKARFALPLIFVLFCLAITMAGPCIIPRYLFPVTFTIPLIYGAYSSNKIKRLSEKYDE